MIVGNSSGGRKQFHSSIWFTPGIASELATLRSLTAMLRSGQDFIVTGGGRGRVGQGEGQTDRFRHYVEDPSLRSG